MPLDATGGHPPYKFKKVGKLPKGLKLKRGVISGVPTKATGTILVTIQVSDKLKIKKRPTVKQVASKQFFITVS